MGSLQPRLEIDGCLFSHVEPWLDPHKVEDLWYFDGPPDSPQKLARSFAAVPHRALFIGHLHRWLLGTPDGLLPWRGEGPVRLDHRTRYLAVVHAVWAQPRLWRRFRDQLGKLGRMAKEVRHGPHECWKSSLGG
jgi:hypothetical protein